MVLGLSSSGFGSLKIFLAIALILYVYLWMHDKEKAMVVTRGIGSAIFAVFKLLFKVLEGIVGGFFRLFSKK